jgi:large subunit ribosomal protein L23
MNLLDVIQKPVITEASVKAMDDKKYTFDVDTKATKTTVKKAVEAAFEGVSVKSVNIMNVKPKKKRVGKYVGYTNKRRKAIVTLTEDSKEIEIFAAE